MSENYCTTRGLGWAFLIVAGFIYFVPVGMTYRNTHGRLPFLTNFLTTNSH